MWVVGEKEKLDVEKELKMYKEIVAKIRMLEQYPVGNGISIRQTRDGDLLQDLHEALKGIPSYMYLNKREQEQETVAHVYLDGNYPLGTKSQLHAVRRASGSIPEDEKRLVEIRRKVKKVLEARSGEVPDRELEAVLERVSKLQELQDRKELIDNTLDALEIYEPKLAQLLRLRYVEGKSVEEAAIDMNISSRTFERWRPKAMREFARFRSMA